jgi:hypothetical protein
MFWWLSAKNCQIWRIREMRSLFALTLILALSGSAAVRAQVADAAIEVTVLDDSQQPMPGVAVTAINAATGLVRTIVTNTDGTARVPALPPGEYEVKFELSGFAPLSRRILLRVGESGRIDVVMKIANVAETVTVTGESPMVDVFKTDSSTNIVPEQIEALPVQDRDFQRLAFLAPGVQRERGGFRFIGGGPVIGAGGNASQSTILVDGVDFTDPVLGLARARFSQDAISEFRVVANRFDSEIGGSAGGALSIVTKSGTNNLNGSVFGFFRDDGLRAKGELETVKGDYSRNQYGLAIGGPIMRDKTHFFGSFEQIAEDNVVLFRPGGSYAGLAGEPPVPIDQSLLYAGLDHILSSTQNLRTKFVYERFRQENFRVGGVVDETAGMRLDRDNFNFTGTHSWTSEGGSVNQLSLQVGRRKFDEPNNSTALAEFFSSGNTLQTGANAVGDQTDTGDIFEVRDTYYRRVGTGRWAADMKIGGAWLHVTDRWNFPVYPQDLMIYVTDTRALPLLYVDASGTGESEISTDIVSAFVQADLRPTPRLTVNLGLRYDLDTEGNNPDYTSPLQPSARGRDTNNIQPRARLSWDLTGSGQHVVRGGVGVFTGRFLLVPAHVELQQNGYTGRIIQQRINGVVIGVPAFPLDPANPTRTGIPLPRDAGGIAETLVNPYALQLTGGYTVRLGHTGLFADFEGIHVRGEDEIIIRDVNWRGNALRTRPNSSFNQINLYSNEGYSRYSAFVTSVNGNIRGGHLLTASVTVADKKNINDDFSPAVTDYPNDPADIAAEYGRSRADERVRFVASGVFRLPYRFQLAPIFEYGSGQPWNHRIGYDFNGDGKNSDRSPGVPRFSEDGPRFASLNLRASHRLPLGERHLEFIFEAFNLFNRVNYDVNSLLNGEFLSGPTAANPALPTTVNPRFGQYTATLPPREIQLGVRFAF